jgi:FAD/FMN-containing dehydrogenase/Fe-S oxidoreductase
MDSLQRDLKEAVRGEVRFDKLYRTLYSTDASVYQIVPRGVVVPKSARDVEETLRICRDHGVPITARGGGTSQSGQAVGSGIQLDFSKHMRRVLALDPERRTVRVEPGIVIEELNARLAEVGLHLPLDLSTANRATVGGMIANNSSGTRSIVYGSTIDWVSELKLLLADGTVVTMRGLQPEELEQKCRQDDLEGRCYRMVRDLGRTHADEIRDRFPKVLRRVGGYNLDRFVASDGTFDLGKLIVGSEGTLGLVLEAEFRLTELPGPRVLAVAQFRDLADAMTATPVILQHDPSAVELMDRNLLEMTRGKTEFEPLRSFIVGDPGAILIVEFMATHANALPARIDDMEAAMVAAGTPATVHRALDAPAQARIWKLRKAGLGLSLARTGDTKAISFVEDTAVAPERLSEYVARFQRILDSHETRAVFYAHASVGLLHIRPAVDMKTVLGVERFEKILEDVSDLVLEFGGALSAEHGDGLARSPFQEKMFGPRLYQAFCEIKNTFDGSSLLNPGKIVNPAPLTANLQYGPDYQTREIATAFDFSDFGGISRAAEQCGGVGTCRKTTSGTMCPSFMATRDEGDSTRGRANALRMAISGQLGSAGLTDPDLMPVLDLCLECKACKSECPTGVDMARLKSEFLHQYQRVHGASFRSRLLGQAERVAIWSSRLAPITNWVQSTRSARWLADVTLGIDRRRRFPTASRHTFTSRWNRDDRAGTRDSAGDGRHPDRLALFVDTFTEFYEPVHGRSAARIAAHLGWDVVVPPRVCCGRPLISKGFLEEARRQAEDTTRTLSHLASAGVPIVFCEPGCFSAVRDDHPRLVGEALRADAERVAARATTFEQWALRAVGDTGQVDRDPRRGSETGSEAVSGRVLVHGHCHQKALVGMQPTVDLLSALTRRAVMSVDAGCCGMAGSFGYEREHYSLSERIGERSLFPALRERAGDTVVVAPGFSCRHQIRHFTGVEPVSTMQLVESLLTQES